MTEKMLEDVESIAGEQSHIDPDMQTVDVCVHTQEEQQQFLQNVKDRFEMRESQTHE